jgi:hypothetical protein
VFLATEKVHVVGENAEFHLAVSQVLRVCRGRQQTGGGQTQTRHQAAAAARSPSTLASLTREHLLPPENPGERVQGRGKEPKC